MRTLIFLFVIPILSLTLAACAPKPLKKCDAFPKMYNEPPLSILVLPAINETTAADAKEYYMTTIAEPLTLSGYYVFPIEVVSDVLKGGGVYDTETLMNADPSKFREYFGADAVMYMRINRWDTAYYVIAGNVSVGVHCLLKSTTSGEILWDYDDVVVYDTTAQASGGGLAGLVVGLIVTAIQTAATDYVPIAKQVNYKVLQTMPFGKYNPRCGMDRDDAVVIPKR